ncbi:MAG: glycosyltransferase family 2 protein [Fastidiosipilaceae bacterium]
MSDIVCEYSIIIPVYNAESTLLELTTRIKNVMKNYQPYEIVFIDDCSEDKSWQILKELHATNENVKIIHLIRNFGQHNATLCGFRYCNGKYALTLDDDLQHPPEEIPKLIEKVCEGYLVVYGRYRPKNDTFLQNCLSSIFQKMIHYILNIPSSIFLSSFAIYDSKVVKNMVTVKTAYPFIFGLLARSAPMNLVQNIDVEHFERKTGRSNYGLIKYFKYSLNLIINYSSLPLKFVAVLGTVISTASLLYALTIIIRYSLDATYGLIGWNSLIVATTFLGGMILLSLGVVGEYLRRILAEVSCAQQYAIEEMYL